jgi:uncharacterized protein YcbK (DUF882 family)
MDIPGGLLDELVRLSPHFKLQEFNQKQSPLSLEKIKVSPMLIQKLELLRSAIGDKPITITSGYRTPEYNKKVGGVTNSQHIRGNAADIMVKGMSSQELKKYAEKVGFSFIQTYKDKPHLHVDIREPKEDYIKNITALLNK